MNSSRFQSNKNGMKIKLKGVEPELQIGYPLASILVTNKKRIEEEIERHHTLLNTQPFC